MGCSKQSKYNPPATPAASWCKLPTAMSATAANPAIQYLTDAAGNKTAVVLSLADYEALMEDLHDLAVLAERKDEPTVPFDEVLAGLKRDGLLPD